MILALNCPSEIPLWIPMLGGVFAIVIVKQIYGGLGQNFMNPALAARCFLLISFAGKMSSFTLDVYKRQGYPRYHWYHRTKADGLRKSTQYAEASDEAAGCHL